MRNKEKQKTAGERGKGNEGRTKEPHITPNEDVV